MLEFWIGEYFSAFMKLNKRRQSGPVSQQPLSVEAIVLWGKAHGFGEDIEFFIRAISDLDDTFLEEVEKRRPKPKPGKKGRK